MINTQYLTEEGYEMFMDEIEEMQTLQYFQDQE